MAITKSKMADKYANIAATYFAATVADTARFVKFDFPFSVLDKVGLLINRIEYIIGALNFLDASGEWAIAGLCCAATVADCEDTRDPLIVDQHRITRYDHGAAASSHFMTEPFMKDFSGLPGGGILVPPNPFYAFLDSSGAGGLLTVRIRVYYQYQELAVEDYWQLVESRRVVTG